jgi:hypothetical protein
MTQSAIEGGVLELAARCEAATEGGFDLDKAILSALGYAWRGMGYWFHDDSHQWKGPTQVTQSIDAALALVPEDMRDEIEITTLYQVARVTINMNHGDDGCPFYGSNKCNSIPLAICSAALKARAALQLAEGR